MFHPGHPPLPPGFFTRWNIEKSRIENTTRAAECFWRTSRWLIWWWNTWYHFSNKMILEWEIKDAKMSSFFYLISKHSLIIYFLCIFFTNYWRVWESSIQEHAHFFRKNFILYRWWFICWQERDGVVYPVECEWGWQDCFNFSIFGFYLIWMELRT